MLKLDKGQQCRLMQAGPHAPKKCDRVTFFIPILWKVKLLPYAISSQNWYSPFFIVSLALFPFSLSQRVCASVAKSLSQIEFS